MEKRQRLSSESSVEVSNVLISPPSQMSIPTNPVVSSLLSSTVLSVVPSIEELQDAIKQVPELDCFERESRSLDRRREESDEDTESWSDPESWFTSRSDPESWFTSMSSFVYSAFKYDVRLLL